LVLVVAGCWEADVGGYGGYDVAVVNRSAHDLIVVFGGNDFSATPAFPYASIHPNTTGFLVAGHTALAIGPFVYLIWSEAFNKPLDGTVRVFTAACEPVNEFTVGRGAYKLVVDEAGAATLDKFPERNANINSGTPELPLAPHSCP
jgi:hypothetical protein